MKRLLLLIIVAAFIINLNAQWTTNGPYAIGISCVTVWGSNIFAGGDDQVYISTDNGGHWKGMNSSPQYAFAFTTSGTNIFAATNGEVFISRDTGISWIAMDSGLQLYTGDIVSLFASGDNIFVGTDILGTFVYKNSNHKWVQAGSGLPYNGGVVATDGAYAFTANGSNIFAAAGDSLYLSSDNGSSWSGIDSLTPEEYVNSFAISDSKMFMGTQNGVFLSNDNGINWNRANNQGMGSGKEYLAISGANLFADVDESVYLSTDSGDNWTDISAGLTNAGGIYSLAINGATLFAATDNGVWQRDITTGIQELTASSIQFNLYPNPAPSNFTIQTSVTGSQQLQLFDITGKLLLSQTIQNSKTSIDASGLASGIYLVSLKSNEGLSTEKLVVEK